METKEKNFYLLQGGKKNHLTIDVKVRYNKEGLLQEFWENLKIGKWIQVWSFEYCTSCLKHLKKHINEKAI